jgi:hypothetical protein
VPWEIFFSFYPKELEDGNTTRYKYDNKYDIASKRKSTGNTCIGIVA